MANGQGHPIFRIFPGVEAQLGVRRQERRMHGHGIRMCRNIVGHYARAVAIAWHGALLSLAWLPLSSEQTSRQRKGVEQPTQAE
jgi:hypothetical protein